MRRAIRIRVTISHFLSLLLFAASLPAQHTTSPKSAKSDTKPEEPQLAREIRHQLFVLPYYSVFDYIAFTLDADKVTLTGYVLRPTLKANAEGAVKSLEGVSSVKNLVEVLPKSPSDDEFRRAVYRSIFEDSTLQRYATLEVPVEIGGREVLPRGARVAGHVTTSRPSGRLEGRAVIGITLDSVESNGRAVPERSFSSNALLITTPTTPERAARTMKTRPIWRIPSSARSTWIGRCGRARPSLLTTVSRVSRHSWAAAPADFS